MSVPHHDLYSYSYSYSCVAERTAGLGERNPQPMDGVSLSTIYSAKGMTDTSRLTWCHAIAISARVPEVITSPSVCDQQASTSRISGWVAGNHQGAVPSL